MRMGDATDAPTNPRFASDIYSFVMCMIEAFSDEPPYALDDDDTILEKVFSGEGYPRPEGLADDEWALVKRLTVRRQSRSSSCLLRGRSCATASTRLIVYVRAAVPWWVLNSASAEHADIGLATLLLRPRKEGRKDWPL
ncbi:hypothetical protein PF008_g26591 [Phytophthora fragariae]|uniref:Protein kinase domain-containing protein n=1 Tax=Phytophthora fragariae TaxID=53985 RepID=A0A6G0QGM0_9STRA|nr:hypothetical protein PF008_g26591 [Phytophthora fragariae]